MFQKKQFLLLIATFTITVIFAQEREQDTLNSDVINVIKPYAPTISDAFKVKEIPTLDDVETAIKKEVNYNIFSFPVASTFTPAKGKAAVVDKAKKVKLFDNYASLAVGTYTTILGEAYINHEIGRGQNLIAEINHHSSGGGIDDLLTDDDFLDSKIDLTWIEQGKGFDWSLIGGFGIQSYNWYGIEQSIFTQIDADVLDVKHNFTDAHISGALNFDDGIFKNADLLFRRFGDNQGSVENRFKLSGAVDIPVKDETVSTVVSLDYLSGNFDRNYFTDTEINFGNIQLSVAPTYQLKKDDLTVNLGVTLTYLNDTEASKSSFFIYPNISASYRIVDEVIIAFGGVKGGLIQNSYFDFATENPFVSPTLFIAPTDQQYNVYAGLNGKLSNTIGYSVSGSYISEKGKALFQNNLVPYGFDNNESYHYGNSFGITYDDVTTLSATGALNVDINRNFTLGIKGEYFVYNTKNEAEAWNLPDFKGSLFMDYQINEHWFAGANLFFVGARKDIAGFNVIENPSVPTFLNPTRVITLDSYFDANAHVGYHVNDRISVFVKGNNLVGENYTKWQNTPVQGIQFLAGATYKFDF
ncbi:TonB-dependent receptor [Lacinutrix jangbogonensis]|uniref:TonB-dependent receptor n=1 Tax=Lacinutrix jangbogonensis TaxID=1469557 RepID=UPI00053CFE71|nr:TonB-dependent receptor [Lacinutrix jangbogonensis]